MSPPGSKFFPCKADTFSKEGWSTGKQTGSHKSCLPCKTWQKIYQVYPVSLTSNSNEVFVCVCVEVLRPSQPNGIMLSVVSLPKILLLGRLSPLSR